MKHLVNVSLMLLIFATNLLSQEASVNPLEKGVTHNLTDDGKYFVKFGASMEFWARYAQLNPGSVDFTGKEIKNDFDFVLRRINTSTMIKLDRFLFFSMIGIGTQTMTASASPFTSAKPTFLLYDIFGSYEFVPKYLRVGYGLSLYRGLSRYSSASATRTIGSDVPMMAAPDVITTEQTARHLGIFATGNIGSLSYRVIFGKPFVVNGANRPAFGLDKAADVPNNHYSYEGYFNFQFFEKEGNLMPFLPASYLGQKKIFNIGAGFYYHPKSTQSITSAGDTVTNDKLHLAADVFLDLPISGGAAFTFYSAFFSFNYGPNYLLGNGVANVYSTPAGKGISEPGFGTGKALATQLAWLFPKTFGKASKVQIYYEGEYKFYDALNDPALHHNIGINYFIFGHNLKFTLQEELRPYFVNGNIDSHKGMTILKTQVYF